MSFLAESRNENELVEPRVSLHNVPITALRHKSRWNNFTFRTCCRLTLIRLIVILGTSSHCCWMPRRFWWLRMDIFATGVESFRYQAWRNPSIPWSRRATTKPRNYWIYGRNETKITTASSHWVNCKAASALSIATMSVTTRFAYSVSDWEVRRRSFRN